MAVGDGGLFVIAGCIWIKGVLLFLSVSLSVSLSISSSASVFGLISVVYVFGRYINYPRFVV